MNEGSCWFELKLGVERASQLFEGYPNGMLVTTPSGAKHMEPNPRPFDELAAVWAPRRRAIVSGHPSISPINWRMRSSLHGVMCSSRSGPRPNRDLISSDYR